MRVLFVNRMVSLERGGGETFDLEIAKHLQGLGCEISFLTGLPLFRGPRIPSPYSGFRSPVSSFHIRSPYFGWFPWDKVKGGWRLRVADFWMFERRAVSWIARHASAMDIIQACELPTLVAGVKRLGLKVPVVMRITAPNVFDPAGGVVKADAVIASGTSVEKVRADARPDCLDIPNAVDTDLFRPHASGFRKQHGIPDDDLVLLYVARFQDFKNHEMLVRAFHAFQRDWTQARLLLVGSGPLERSVRQQVRQLGLGARVQFLGEVPYDRMPDLYAAADIKVISSWYESFCFAALEAMATGLPIVTTDCGWVPKLIGNGAGGRVVPLNNAASFAAAMLELARDPGLRRTLGRANRETVVRDYRWETSAAKLLDLYRRLMAGAGGAV